MSYQRGDAKLITRAVLDTEWGWEPGDDPPKVSDSRGDYLDPPVVRLPHSCDAWVIGGPDEVAQMIADLTALLAQMKP